MKKSSSISLKTRERMSQAKIARKEKLGYINSPEAREKMSKSSIGKKKNYVTSGAFKKGHIPWSVGMKGEKSPGSIASKRILKEVVELQKQGFICIPIDCGVIPDIIAFKDGKIYAYEVEYGRPNYSKYNKNDYKKYFDKVIWLIRRKQ